MKKTSPIRMGNIYGPGRGTGFAGNIWDKDAVSPTITTCGGGHREPMILDIIYEDNGQVQLPDNI